MRLNPVVTLIELTEMELSKVPVPLTERFPFIEECEAIEIVDPNLAVPNTETLLAKVTSEPQATEP